MNIKDSYLNNKSNILFSTDTKVINNRKKIFEKISNGNLIKKYKENIKNLNLSDIINLKYLYKNNLNKSSITNNDERIYYLNIENGFLDKFDDSKISIDKINSKNNISKIILDSDFIVDLNYLFMNSGFELRVKKNSKIIININYTFSDNNLTVFQKNLINCDENSDVTIIENYESDLSFFHNNVTSIDLNENCKVKHIIMQKNKENKNLFVTTYTNCKKNSRYEQTTFNFSDGFVRNCHYTDLNESFSSVNYNGVFFLKNANSSENKTFVCHKSESCTSDQNYKGVLNDTAKGIYNSFTIVDKNAKNTEGYQLSKGILLSDNSTFFSKPELRINTDDVKCSHGSTIGPLDDQLIYYIRSRGIGKKQAINLLVKSFVEENILKINNLKVQHKIENYMNKYLSEIN